MQSLVGKALYLAKLGFHVFPLSANSKIPLKGFSFPELATTDERQIRKWWNQHPNYNIGISTTRFGDGEYCLVGIDVDNKDGKQGDVQFMELAPELALTQTFEQTTPTGGRHLIYKTKTSMRQRPLSDAIDIRGHHGYLVGAGSVIDGKEYTCFAVEVAEASTELVDRLTKVKEKKLEANTVLKVDHGMAFLRAGRYLMEDAPLAIQGDRGDETTFIVACHLKNLGVPARDAFGLMDAYWNDRCSPPWELSDLELKVLNAYQYSQEGQGSKAPEVLFGDPDESPEATEAGKVHPILELNKEYAFLINKGKAFIINESKLDGEFYVEYLTVQAFKEKLLPQTIMYNDKKHQLASLWMSSPDRRGYDRIVFEPSGKVSAKSYNLWRGFAHDPAISQDQKATRAVELFLNHALENICDNDHLLFHWLMGFFAHLIQKPWEKPLTAVVFKGRKGVGKNVFIEVMGELVGSHFLVASNSRYLTSNFNSHLERCLLFLLDEAFWSGDKKAEGQLKDVITGSKHLIERKGAEVYSVKNCTRVAIIGNEDWLIPASHDERRFAVFNVGNKRRNDRKFFGEILDGLRAGGFSHLMQYLMDFDLSEVDVNIAPNTEGLAEQKISSLPPFQEWWFECLKEGRIINADFSAEWNLEIGKDSFRNAYRRFIKERGIKLWGETPTAIGIILNKCLPSVRDKRKMVEGSKLHVYQLPNLETARSEWDTFIGHKTKWDPL